MKVAYARTVGNCPAWPLALEGHLELVRDGFTEEKYLEPSFEALYIDVLGDIQAVLIWAPDDDNRVIINLIYVKPEHRSQGLFQTLWQHLKDRMDDEGYGPIVALVHANNHVMRSACRKMQGQEWYLEYQFII